MEKSFYGIRIEKIVNGSTRRKFWHLLPDGNLFYTEYEKVAEAMIDNARMGYWGRGGVGGTLEWNFYVSEIGSWQIKEE